MGAVETAIRAAVAPGDQLHTPARADRFEVASLDDQGIVLLLGAGRHRTLIPWTCLEGVPTFLGKRLGTRVGGSYSTDADSDTLDGYLKQFVNRATAGWVAALLERAGIVTVDSSPPATLRLSKEFRSRIEIDRVTPPGNST